MTGEAPKVVQPPEQLRYAWWLDLGTRIGLVTLLSTFVLFLAGWPESLVSPQRMVEFWSQPVADYLRATGAPTGWQWLHHLARGDVLAMLGIVLLSGCSLLCLAALVPLYRARGDRIYLALCIAEALVITLAASGVLTAGH